VQEKAQREGERSYVYRGVVRKSGAQVIVKVAKTPQDNQYLEREARICALFTTASARSARAGVARYVPHVLDTCYCVGTDGKRYMANVVQDVPGVVSVAKILEVYPQGLDAPQAAWVARRILAQPLIAAMAGVVHTAILPQHVLVHPVTHEPLHIGWTHALDVGTHAVLLNVVSQYVDYYPPEVFDKVSFSHQMDIYMATKTVIALFGGVVKTNVLPKTVPSAIAALLRSGVEKDPRSRPQDGKVFLDEFTRIVRKEWGSTYRALTMPA
jgi:hypothetical protein